SKKPCAMKPNRRSLRLASPSRSVRLSPLQNARPCPAASPIRWSSELPWAFRTCSLTCSPAAHRPTGTAQFLPKRRARLCHPGTDETRPRIASIRPPASPRRRCRRQLDRSTILSEDGRHSPQWPRPLCYFSLLAKHFLIRSCICRLASSAPKVSTARYARSHASYALSLISVGIKM